MPQAKVTLEGIYEKMGEFLFRRPVMKDVLNIVLGTVVARRFNLENCWVMLVGAPSTGKSLMLQPLSGNDKTFFVDDISEACLISGYRDEAYEKAHNGERKEVSLGKQLHNKVLVIKDLTRLVQKGQASQTVMDQLRVLYDGEYRGGYGNDSIITIYSKFNILAACTNVIDSLTSNAISLGERFLYFRIPPMNKEEEIQMACAALDASPAFAKHYAELTGLFTSFISNSKFDLPVHRPEQIRQLTYLARMVTKLRAHQARDYKGNIMSPPQDEGPSRVAKQLLSLCYGIAAANREGEVTEDAVRLAKLVAVSSMPEMRRRLVSVFWDHLYHQRSDSEGPISHYYIMDLLRISEYGAQKLLNDLYSAELIGKSRVCKDGARITWVASPRLAELVEDAGVEELLLGPNF